jgi:hypothetical protein
MNCISTVIGGEAVSSAGDRKQSLERDGPNWIPSPSGLALDETLSVDQQQGL